MRHVRSILYTLLLLLFLKYHTSQTFGIVKKFYAFERNILGSKRLHLFDKKYSKN